MFGGAEVRSLDELREFRNALVEFCHQVKNGLGAIELDLRRAVDWIELDRSPYWRSAKRQREEELSQAKIELSRRRLGRIGDRPPDVTEQKKAVSRAERRLSEAEVKVENTNRWRRELPRMIDLFRGPAGLLYGMVESTPPPIVVVLDKLIASLDAYLAVQAPTAPVLPPLAIAGDENPTNNETRRTAVEPEPAPEAGAEAVE